MDSYTTSYLQNAVAWTLLKKYATHLCHCDQNCQARVEDLKNVAERMLNDGTITKEAYTDVIQYIDELVAAGYNVSCDDQVIKITKEVIKSLVSDNMIDKFSPSDEFVRDLNEVKEIKTKCKAIQMDFVVKYNMEEIAKELISKYLVISCGRTN